MKRVLITINGSANDRDSLASAARICRHADAALTVAVARVAHRTVGLFGGIVSGPETTASSEDITAEARAAFDAILGTDHNAEFVAYQAEEDEVIAAIGHAYDLVIVERIAHADAPEVSALNAALFETGRPALVAPPGRLESFGHRIAANWNGTRQATRAIGSAMALLTRAEEVVLLLGSDMDPGPPLPMADYLRIHGAKVTTSSYDSHQLTARGRGRALLSAVRDVGADLLVTGAYGDGDGGFGSLGRATQKVVSGAAFPVLLQS